MSKIYRIVILSLVFTGLMPITGASAVDTANNTTVTVGNSSTGLNSGSCKGDMINGYCTDFMVCDSEDSTILKVSFQGAEPGDPYWKAGNIYCQYSKAGKAVSTVHNLAPCLKYFQVYRFYGDTTNPAQVVNSSRAYTTMQCQNLAINSIATPFKLRLFTPNPWDSGKEVATGTPWNYKNLTIPNDIYNKKSGKFTVYSSDQCNAIDAVVAYNPNCRLTTGPSTSVSNDKTCVDLSSNNASSFNSELKNNSNVTYLGKATTVSQALKEMIFSIVTQNYASQTAMKAMTVNSLAWLPFTSGASASQITYKNATEISEVDGNYNCSSAMQYIPVTTSTISKNTVVGACIIGVGDTVHSFRNASSNTFGFAHYGDEVYSTGGNKNGALSLDRFLPTNLTSSNVDTGIPSQLIASTQPYTSQYLTALKSEVGNGSIQPYLSLLDSQSNLNAAQITAESTSSYTERVNSFNKYVKCFSQTFKPQLLEVENIKNCPDGTLVPTNGVCPVKCPDGSTVNSLTECESTAPVVNCTSPCIGVTLNTPAQFVVGGSMRPQTVKATATYNLTNNCGHDACRSNGGIKLDLRATSTGKYTKCATPSGGNGCSYYYEVTGSGNNSNELTFKFFSATNPGEIINIISSVVGHYDYMDLIPQPPHPETRGFGSNAYTVMVPTPPIERWTNNVTLTNSSQNKVKGVPVIGSIGG